jgi:hypothetical protein
MGRIVGGIHRFRKNSKRRRTGKEIDPATMGWTTVMTSCILTEQLFDFIP